MHRVSDRVGPNQLAVSLVLMLPSETLTSSATQSLKFSRLNT